MLHHIKTLFLVGFIALSSCSKQNPISVVEKKELRLCIPEEPLTLDPRKGGDAVSSHLHFMLFEGLTSLNEDGSVNPAQCYQIDISDDLKTYTFHMGRTLWSDGSRVTSYDFEKSWKDILSPSFPSPNAHLLYPIKGAEAAKRGEIPISMVGIHAPDPYTLIVELSQPTPYFLKLVSFCVFFPVSKALDDENPSWAFNHHKTFSSNGPFCLKEWKHHNEIRVEKNPLYHSPEKVALDAIRLSIIASEMTTFQMYENEEIDFVGHPFSMLPFDAVASLMKTQELKTTPAAATTFITFNTGCFPFNNLNMRKAFSLAIHRDEIVSNMTQLGELVATDAVPPILKNGRSQPFYTDHQPDLARYYLDLALKEMNISKKDLNQITFNYSMLENHHKVAQVLQQQWLNTLGVHVKLQSIEHKNLLEKLGKKDFSFGLTIWRAQYFDPTSILDRFKHRSNAKNYSGWENEQFQQLLDLSSSLNGEQRLDMLEKAEEIFLRDFPVAPLYHWSLCYLNRPYLKNIQFSPVGGIFFERLSIDKKSEDIR
jgi:oligopeptide transport system substrate-binding protein